MRITLYNPSTFYYTGTRCSALPSLSITILSAVLNNAGHDCQVVDLEALGIKPQDMKIHDADVIGFTGMTMAEQGIRDCIQAMREMGYKGRIVAGGIHATLFPQQVLEWGADLVVTGECEGNIVQLLESDAVGIHKGIRSNIEDIPAPDWEHHTPSISVYSGMYKFIIPNPGVSMWSRGCNFRCVFCSDIIYNHQQTRYRKPVDIAAEMAGLKARGIEHVYVYDDEMIGTKQPGGWMKEIADRIKPLGMKWVCQGRTSARYITQRLMADMKRAGCTTILWGAESMSDHALQAMNKHTTTADIWHSLRMAKLEGINNLLFTMIGNYQENEDDLRITADNLQRAYREGLVDYLQTFTCAIMPGTELERLSKAEGWYTPAEHGNLKMKKVHRGTPWLSAKTIKDYREVYRKVCPVMI
jgi:anaerobic magnesium-protoporphyrin IX monomethyl ester cyclase